MRNILTNIRASQGSAPIYDPDFQAWIDYNILQGHYITSDTIKLDAANQYVIDSKADGTWQGKDVDFIFAWNDLQMADASLVCLKRLIKFDVYGGCTYTVNGWEGNGVDGYIDINFTPNNNGVNFIQDDASYGYLTYKVPTSTYRHQIGNEVSIFFQLLRDESSNRQSINTNDLVSPNVDLSGLGLKSANRVNSNDVYYYNKSTQFIRTQVSVSAYLTAKLYLFRTGERFANGGQSYVFTGRGFTQSENESIRTNLNTYLTSIGLTPIA